MRYLSVFRPVVLAVGALLVMSVCGCETKREARVSPDFIEMVSKSSSGSASRANAQEILLGANNYACAVYPEDIPELYADKTIPHKVYWRALGPHSFTINFLPANWPFVGPNAAISVPKGGSSNIYYVSSDPHSPGGDLAYTVTYDSNLPCTFFIPDVSSMGVHVTK